MSDLTMLEKRTLEKLLQMSGGYVLNFSNRSLDALFVDSIGKSIYENQYEVNGNSKANRMRAFWQIEPNHMVGKLLDDLLKYYKAERASIEYLESTSTEQLIEACQRTIQRLLQSAPVPEIASIIPNSVEKDFAILAKSIKESIDKNEPEAGLDRLHTFTVKYLRNLCEKCGISTERDKPLHSLAGEYIKRLKEQGDLESEMTERILKSSLSVLEAFNHVRNNQSLAHDNPILNYDESLLIFNHITNAIKFIQALEQKKATRQKQAHSKSEVIGGITF